MNRRLTEINNPRTSGAYSVPARKFRLRTGVGEGKLWGDEMDRIWRKIVVLLIALLAVGGFASAQTTHEVQLMIQEVEGRPLPYFFFEPTGLYVEPGDTVRFIAVTPHHTVTAYHSQQGKQQRVPDGVEPFSSPVIPIGEAWEYTFETPGVYDVWCGPHEMYGMAMRIVVGEAAGPGATPPDDMGPDGTFGTAGLVLGDPALDPENIIEVQAVPWTDLSDDSKGIPNPDELLGEPMSH